MNQFSLADQEIPKSRVTRDSEVIVATDDGSSFR